MAFDPENDDPIEGGVLDEFMALDEDVFDIEDLLDTEEEDEEFDEFWFKVKR